MDKTIAKLQYITQDIERYSHTELALRACEAGVKWIQLRVKNISDEEYLSIAENVKAICYKFNTTFIINDNVAIAKAVNADGVHLGKTDMHPTKARDILGTNCIIGATANTFEDILLLSKSTVDYIGLGPYQFTNTKKNLSPILGIEGYKTIIKQCNDHQIEIPIIGIGGITTNNFDSLLKLGLHGVAISSAITEATNIRETVKAFESKSFPSS